jgi:antitoxin component YwqK of YwqJK toxin-antitoxin module
MPPALEAQQPTPAGRRAAGAPGLLSAPAVGQASPLLPEETPTATASSASSSKPRPSSRRRQSPSPSEPQPAEPAPQPLEPAPQPQKLATQPQKLAPQAAKLVPQPAKLAPEPLEPMPETARLEPAPLEPMPEPSESASQPIASPSQPDDESSTRQGQWTQWENGRALWTCEFRAGVRHGKATRYFIEGEGPLFAESLADGFEAPFEAQAVFVQGKVDGVCTIVDSSKRTLCQLSLKADELEGECTWFFPTGDRHEVSHYHAGRLEGKRLEYNRDGELVKDEDYLGGRPTATELTFDDAGQKKMRGNYYLAGPLTSTHFDWMRGDLATTVIKDFASDVRTGQWTWWHSNGQPQLEGHYEEDVPTGTFTWWYPNGQKQRQGSYVEGVQSGKWSWWFATGQKQIEGVYVAGEVVGQWQYWAEDGTRIRRDAATLAVHATQPKPATPAARPQVIRQAQPRKNTVR